MRISGEYAGEKQNKQDRNIQRLLIHNTGYGSRLGEVEKRVCEIAG